MTYSRVGVTLAKNASTNTIVRDKSYKSRFDTIVAMDKKNVRDIKTAVKEWAEDPANRIEVPAAMKKVVLMADYCRDPSHTEMRDIPDVSARVSPYYGGAAQFKLVLDVLEDACEGLMQELVDMLSCHMTGMVECEHDTMHQCYV
eukprot:1192860-Prorocentrum_minimum.AAC.10